MLRLITLDVNNTLLRVRGSVGQLYSKTAKDYGYSFDTNTLESEFHKAYKKYYKKYPNFGARDNVGTKYFWHQIVRSTFTNSGCKDDAVISQIASKLYSDFALPLNWVLFEDVALVLKHLKNKGYKMGVVSNFDERLPSILEGLGILKYFSFVLCSTEVGVAKPCAKIFQLALQRGGVRATEALHIGDNVTLDYRAAKAVGMSAYLIDRFNNVKQKDGIDSGHVIQSLEALLEL